MPDPNRTVDALACCVAALTLAAGCGQPSSPEQPEPPSPSADMAELAPEDMPPTPLPDMRPAPAPDAGPSQGRDMGRDMRAGEMSADMAEQEDPLEVDCSQGVRRPGPEETFERLAEYCFFEGPIAEQRPRDGVVPYEVNARLYSDGTHKRRFIVLPPGETITFEETDRWDYPRGTIIIKTFLAEGNAQLGRRVLETRLLTREGDGRWRPQTYLWDEDQRAARRHLIGAKIELQPAGFDEPFTYQVPNKNQCKNCHGQDRVLEPLGPRTRQLNGVSSITGQPQNQLERMAALGMFDREIGPVDQLESIPDYRDDSAPLHERALAYLEANCGHCHNPDGSGGTSGLHLEFHGTEGIDYGVCRRPVAAGGASGDLSYDIDPGKPERSILLQRMKSQDPEVKMPELPLRTVDPEGVAIVEQWISEMDGACDSP